MVNDTVNNKDNLEEKTREDPDIRIYHISWLFFDRMWYALMMVVDMRVFLFSTCLTTLSTWELVVDDTVDNKDNLEQKTREDADIRMYYLGLNLFN